jgi:hypothetical protein
MVLLQIKIVDSAMPGGYIFVEEGSASIAEVSVRTATKLHNFIKSNPHNYIYPLNSTLTFESQIYTDCTEIEKIKKLYNFEKCYNNSIYNIINIVL